MPTAIAFKSRPTFRPFPLHSHVNATHSRLRAHLQTLITIRLQGTAIWKSQSNPCEFDAVGVGCC
jgi:hypothetical protein